ncbi:MAG: L,D-transpeptidase family protein [Gammaproteobacteria bacterium]|nr:L,D-transpeptidase family protein [Gammaproteobacteria bacterium]
MLRQLITVAASLILLPWQAPTYAAPEVGDEAARDAATAISDLGSQYQRLGAQLQQYRALAEAGGWPEVPDGPTIRPDAEDPRLATLARRLHVSGDIAAADMPVSTSEYNETLQNAVRRFQARHGLEADALVGRATLRSLNVTVQQRIDQIRVNLERLRWHPDTESHDLVLVNIPAFKAYVIRDGQIVWTTNVIVGDPENKTPVFQSMLKSVVFNPTWTVPYSIASKEMLPKIKRDPAFFRRGNYELFDRAGNPVDSSSVDWSTVERRTFPFTLVQQPGPANQLGQVKFMIPNDYSVCMHDTPAKSLFASAVRAFSHGCIRIEEPLGLAEVLLGSENWTRKQVDSQVESRETRSIVLAEPLPVHVVYWTAEVDDLGVMHFYDDIYEWDATVLERLDKPFQSDHHDQPAASY